jgi:hypothetical protein
MSHIVTIETQMKDPVAIEAACRRLSLASPVHGSAKLYSGEVAGVVVNLPGWQYPIVIDTSLGKVHYDDFEGAWGDQKHLGLFLQAYAVEKAKLEARKKGYSFSEQQLQDGSIQVRINHS